MSGATRTAVVACLAALPALAASCSFSVSGVDGDGGGPEVMGVDTDGDTIDDAIDNCPTMANPDQRDHDGDLAGDVCDPCPHIAGFPDPDRDGDGIGDACDPRPDMVGDERALWQGFEDEDAIASWLVVDGTWTVSGGKLHQTTVQELATIIVPGSWSNTRIMTRVEIVAVGTPMSTNTGTIYPMVGTLTGVVDDDQYFACYAFKSSSNQLVARSWYRPVYRQSNEDWTGDLVVGATFAISQTVVGDNVCLMIQEPALATGMDDEQIGLSNTGSFGLVSGIAGVSFDYLFVAATP